MKRIFSIFIIAAVFTAVISGCTNAQMSQYKALGSRGKIVCYSGGVKIYEGTSSGKILTEEGSDGWYFEEDGTGKLIRTNSDCLIEN